MVLGKIKMQKAGKKASSTSNALPERAHSYVHTMDLNLDTNLAQITPYSKVTTNITIGLPQESTVDVEGFLKNNGGVLAISPDAFLASKPWVALDVSLAPNQGRRFLFLQILLRNIERVIYPEIFLRSSAVERLDPNVVPVFSPKSRNMTLIFDLADLGKDTREASKFILSAVFKGKVGTVEIEAIQYAWF